MMVMQQLQEMLWVGLEAQPVVVAVLQAQLAHGLKPRLPSSTTGVLLCSRGLWKLRYMNRKPESADTLAEQGGGNDRNGYAVPTCRAS
jgi:hypothetical protein